MAQKKDDVCPNCGHCPHCGQSPQRFQPYNPWYPGYPYTPTFPLPNTSPPWIITTWVDETDHTSGPNTTGPVTVTMS